MIGSQAFGRVRLAFFVGLGAVVKSWREGDCCCVGLWRHWLARRPGLDLAAGEGVEFLYEAAPINEAGLAALQFVFRAECHAFIADIG